MIGVPCNQFHYQEPGANSTEIMNGITHVRPGFGFVPNFPLTEKIEVNGKNQDPLFTYLKKYCEPTSYGMFGMNWSPIDSRDVRWNFEKFLIGRDGKPVKRYYILVDPTEPRVQDDITAELKKSRHDGPVDIPVVG